jgi:hypothetical protein
LFASGAISFIDKFMGCRIGDYFLFGKCNSIFILCTKSLGVLRNMHLRRVYSGVSTRQQSLCRLVIHSLTLQGITATIVVFHQHKHHNKFMSLQQRSQRPLDIKGKANKCFKRFVMISVELAIDQRLRSCLVDMRNCPKHTSYERFIGEVSDVTDSIDASDMGFDKVFIKEGWKDTNSSPTEVIILGIMFPL